MDEARAAEVKSGVHITPEMVEAAYELLRRTPPFSRWGLPHPDKVEFRVHYWLPGAAADYELRENRHIIRVSAARHTQLSSLLTSVAHELCHLRQALRGEHIGHGASFRRYAAQACRRHGWDIGVF